MRDGTQVNMDSSPGKVEAPDEESLMRKFVRTPFSVRCNVVKVWRPLPAGFWTTLIEPDDIVRARRAELLAVASVLAMAVALVVVFSGIGVSSTSGDSHQCFPLVGKPSLDPISDPAAPGLYFDLWLSFPAVFWAVGPSLAGWAFVRLLWIPAVVKKHPSRGAIIAIARHLGGVYLYVYAMICVGAVLMLPVARIAPAETAFIRWCFWCFLFGESFFVPGVMWIRLVLADRSSEIFGRARFALLAGYLALFVVAPIYGMTLELD